jgi:flagellar M-ring protein FliF
MRQFLNDFQKNLKGIWSRLDGGQRLIVSAVLVASLVGLGGMVWFAGQPTYVAVFEAQSGDELKEAKRLLQAAGIAVVPDDAGMGLKVESKSLGLANSVLAEGNLRGSGSRPSATSSIVDDADTRAANLSDKSRQQAETVIAALEGVRSASVLSNRPRRSPFANRDRETQPTASVSLRLKPGVSFEPVARSAASLAASQLMVPLENVTVINAVSHQRWRFDPDREAGGGTAEFLAQQRSIGDERSRLAQEALDALYPGKTIVTVGVELDSKWEITNQKVIPEEQLMLSEQVTKDSSKSGDTQMVAAGDPSTGAANPQPTSTKSDTKKETTKREFVADIGEKRSGHLAPAIKRMSVALVYDKSLEQKPGFSKDDLTKVVKSIVGWDSQRDDKDAFSTMSGEFAPVEAAAPVTSGPSTMDRVMAWAPTVGQLLGVALVLLFLKSLLKRPASSSAETDAPLPAAVEEKMSPDEQQKRMRKEIERAIASDPAALARVLENWLAETKV